MQIIVRDNNVDQALRALKKKLQREGVYREMKLRRHYEKPSREARPRARRRDPPRPQARAQARGARRRPLRTALPSLASRAGGDRASPPVLFLGDRPCPRHRRSDSPARPRRHAEIVARARGAGRRGGGLAWLGTRAMQVTITTSGLRYQVISEGTGPNDPAGRSRPRFTMSAAPTAPCSTIRDTRGQPIGNRRARASFRASARRCS